MNESDALQINKNDVIGPAKKTLKPGKEEQEEEEEKKREERERKREEEEKEGSVNSWLFDRSRRIKSAFDDKNQAREGRRGRKERK